MIKNLNNVGTVAAFIALLFFTSCSDKVSEYHKLPNISKVNLIIESLDLDSISIDGMPTSMEGQWFISNDKFIFIDSGLPSAITFDLAGNYIDKVLKSGNGPNEITAIIYNAGVLENGSFALIDGNYRGSIYDSSFNNVIDNRRIFSSWLTASSEQINDIIKTPEPESFLMYEYDYNNPIFHQLGDNIVIPIISEHINYNAFKKNNSQFWEDSYTFMFISLDSLKDVKLFGHYPPIYQKRPVPYLPTAIYDVRRDTLYSSHQIDPLLYARDANGKLLYSFGIGAKSLEKAEYPNVESFEEYENNWYKFDTELGYYTSVFASDRYIYRTFKNPKIDSGGGIQIYDNNTLIGEIKTSKIVKLIGEDSNGNIWLSSPGDEQTEMFTLYKFKL